MKILLLIFANILFLISAEAETIFFTIKTDAPENKELQFCLRIPASQTEVSRIMVLFGGRNWLPDKTIKSYNFDKLADRHNLFLLSPGFRNDDYWYPETWSGKALLEAVKYVREKYHLSDSKLLYYGYSAGGQCSNLFYAWSPDLVDAWGAHACGVWCKPETLKQAPALITCGEQDTDRYLLSFAFAQAARGNGASILWRSYPTAHGLNPESLALARAFFESILSNSEKKIEYAGDDQTLKFYPVPSRHEKDIEPELKSVFYSIETAKLWQKQD